MRLRRWLISLVLLAQLGLAAAVLAPAPVRAATEANCTSNTSSSFLNFPVWYKYLSRSFVDDGCKIDFSLQRTKDVSLVALAIFEIVLRVAGIAAVFFVVYGGIQYQMSRGESDRARSARMTVVNALIGLFIAISASTVVNFIARRL